VRAFDAAEMPQSYHAPLGFPLPFQMIKHLALAGLDQDARRHAFQFKVIA
jgi:hypothetical protein